MQQIQGLSKSFLNIQPLSQRKTKHITFLKMNWLMPFKEMIAVSSAVRVIAVDS
jgi:hypothetical protein